MRKFRKTNLFIDTSICTYSDKYNIFGFNDYVFSAIIDKMIIYNMNTNKSRNFFLGNSYRSNMYFDNTNNYLHFFNSNGNNYLDYSIIEI